MQLLYLKLLKQEPKKNSVYCHNLNCLLISKLNIFMYQLLIKKMEFD